MWPCEGAATLQGGVPGSERVLPRQAVLHALSFKATFKLCLLSWASGATVELDAPLPRRSRGFQFESRDANPSSCSISSTSTRSGLMGASIAIASADHLAIL
jgi:hypothetical protein